MMQKFLYAMIFGVSFFLISCMPPRINTVRFDLVYSEMENHHRLRLDHIYIEKPDASALTKEANGDTILRILEIPDFSPIVYKFVTRTDVADWIVYGYKTELEKSGIQVIPVERLPHNVSGFRIKITDSYAGFDNRSAYTRIGYNVTCIIDGNKTAVIEVLGEGLYDTNRRSIVYDPNLMPPALSESMTIALQNAIDGSLPKIQSVLDRGSSY